MKSGWGDPQIDQPASTHFLLDKGIEAARAIKPGGGVMAKRLVAKHMESMQEKSRRQIKRGGSLGTAPLSRRRTSQQNARRDTLLFYLSVFFEKTLA